MFGFVILMLQLCTCNLNLSSSCPISSSIFSAIERQCPHLLPLVGSVHENPHYSFPCYKWRAHTPRQLCAEDHHVILLSVATLWVVTWAVLYDGSAFLPETSNTLPAVCCTSLSQSSASSPRLWLAWCLQHAYKTHVATELKEHTYALQTQY